jgi:hypothetical protein
MEPEQRQKVELLAPAIGAVEVGSINRTYRVLTPSQNVPLTVRATGAINSYRNEDRR